MNDSVIQERIWLTGWQQAVWLEWLQPFLYGLLALAVISLALVLLDLALLCWKEFHAAAAQEPTKEGKQNNVTNHKGQQEYEEKAGSIFNVI